MALAHNVGGLDRGLRVVIGLALISLVIFGSLGTVWAALSFVVGGILLVTGVLRYCPINRMFGIDTCRTKAPPA